MAEGFARVLAPRGILVKSGGLKPNSELDPMAAQLMAERGIDISRHVPKEVDLAFARRADRIVVMGCDPEEACPVEVLDRVEDWRLQDPKGMETDEAQQVRDEIEKRVRKLMVGL